MLNKRQTNALALQSQYFNLRFILVPKVEYMETP